ncbi:MAG: hypothetical protein JW909_11935 [Planctomycetes bacterium]|nr:hypothetical protein [Planctomycetota bacterium]
MRRMIVSGIGIALGLYMLVLYSVPVTVTVDQVVSGKIPMSRLSKNLGGRPVKMKGRVVSEGEKSALDDGSEWVVPIVSAEKPAEGTATLRGRLVLMKPGRTWAAINGKPATGYEIDTDAGLFSTNAVIGLLVTAWGTVLLWAGLTAGRRKAEAVEAAG